MFGTWMFAQLDAPRPKGQYSDIEGGLGWWRDTRFATETCQPWLSRGSAQSEAHPLANRHEARITLLFPLAFFGLPRVE